MRCLLFLLLAVSFPLQSLRAQNACHASDDNSVQFVASFKAMMDNKFAGMRAKLGVPQVDPSQVVLVSDSTTCALAGAAVDSLMNTWDTTSPTLPPSTDPIYVIQIGTAYAVIDLNSPTDDGTEFDSVFVFSAGWVYRGMLAM